MYPLPRFRRGGGTARYDDTGGDLQKLVNAQISLKDRRFRENMSAYEPQFYEALNRLVEMANRYGFSGNLWHDYLTYLLGNKENAFSTSCEIVGKVEGSDQPDGKT